MTTKYPLVVLTWDDAFSDTEHEASPDELLGPQIVHTAGWLVAVTDDAYHVATDWDEEGHVACRHRIPKGMVIDGPHEFVRKGPV